jgi:hypothetical protein
MIFKKTWSILNVALRKTKNKQSITSLFYDNKLITDPCAIAETFNKYFTTIAGEIGTDNNPVNPVYSDLNIKDNDFITNIDTFAGNNRFHMCNVPVSEDE